MIKKYDLKNIFFKISLKNIFYYQKILLKIFLVIIKNIFIMI